MSTVNNMQIQDDEGNVFHPETSIEQIVGENGTQVFPGGKPGNMESSDMTTAFTESKMRENIKSGEKHRVLFGKIQKFFTDLKTVAFSGKYGDLSERPTLGGAAGYKVADNDTTNSSEFLSTARVAYEHGQEIDALSRDLSAVPEFVIDKSTGKITGYKTKAGADTVFPFSAPLLNMKFSQMPKVNYYTSTNLVFENPGYNRLKVTDCNANYWWVYNSPNFDVNNWGNELDTKYQIGNRNDTVFDIANVKYVLIHTKQSENNNSGFGGCKFNLCNE